MDNITNYNGKYSPIRSDHYSGVQGIINGSLLLNTMTWSLLFIRMNRPQPYVLIKSIYEWLSMSNLLYVFMRYPALSYFFGWGKWRQMHFILFSSTLYVREEAYFTYNNNLLKQNYGCPFCYLNSICSNRPILKGWD